MSEDAESLWKASYAQLLKSQYKDMYMSISKVYQSLISGEKQRIPSDYSHKLMTIIEFVNSFGYRKNKTDKVLMDSIRKAISQAKFLEGMRSIIGKPKKDGEAEVFAFLKENLIQNSNPAFFEVRLRAIAAYLCAYPKDFISAAEKIA